MRCEVIDYVQRLESLLENWSRPLDRSLTVRERQTLDEILADIRDLCSSYERALTRLAACCAIGPEHDQDTNEWEARLAYCREQARGDQDCEVLEAAYQRLEQAVSELVRGRGMVPSLEEARDVARTSRSDGD
jgi:hypothetical protein